MREVVYPKIDKWTPQTIMRAILKLLFCSLPTTQMVLMSQIHLPHPYLFGYFTLIVVGAALLIWPEHLALEAEARRLGLKR